MPFGNDVEPKNMRITVDIYKLEGSFRKSEAIKFIHFLVSNEETSFAKNETQLSLAHH